VTLDPCPTDTVRQAGGYAQQRYERGMRSWRGRAIPDLFRTLWIPVALALAGVVLHPSPVAWLILGLTIGFIAALGLAIWYAGPAHVLNWGTGADGERATRDQLVPLEQEGWRAEHDIPVAGSGNIDHLVDGPKGVFLLETKNLAGRIAIVNGLLESVQYDDPERVWRDRKLPKRLRSLALRTNHERILATGDDRWVQPVVVIWGDFEGGVVEAGGIAYVHGSELSRWLRKAKASERSTEEVR
jgi:hypothetical protein